MRGVRDIRRGHSQHPPLRVLLRGILHLPLRHEHFVPALRVLLPAPREHMLFRWREGGGGEEAVETKGQGKGEGKEEGGGEEEEGGEGASEEGEEGERKGEG